LIANPLVAIVSLTITEAGYNFKPIGGLNRDDSHVDEDLENLNVDDYVPHTILFKITGALIKRFKLNQKPIAILSCDNLSANGVRLQAAMSEIFSYLPNEIDQWFRQSVTFPSTSVDRITPKTTESDIDLVLQETGKSDCAPVVTEPFSNWIIQGDFPAGRPAWESAGVVFVNHIEDFENRKLWLLNGAHSLMAYSGLNSGLSSVADAMKNREIREQVESFWDEAALLLPNPALKLIEYRTALVNRFENRRIEHQLSQIAIDGATKLIFRAVPVIKGNVAQSKSPDATYFLIASWIKYLMSTELIVDSRAVEITQALSSTDPIRECVALLDQSLAEDFKLLSYLRDSIENREVRSA
jgi:fructuronate reductase